MNLRLAWVIGCVALCGCPSDDTAGGTEGADTTGTATTVTPSTSTTTVDPSMSGSETTDPQSGSSEGGSSGSSSGGGTSTGGAATSTTTGGAALCEGDEIAGLDSAVAVLYGDLPPLGETSTGSGGGGQPEDDWLWIRLASMEATCLDPRGDTACEEGVVKWWVTIILPPDLQAPGEYDFDELTVYSSGSDGMNCDGGGTSSTNGGGGPEGTLVIDAITADSVTGCLETVDFPRLDANGTFTAENCVP